MLSRSNEQDLMTIAKWARNDGTLLSLIDNPQYPSEVKVMAVKNKKLSGSTLGYIVEKATDYSKEVLIGAISNPNMSRADLNRLGHHHDLDVAMAVFQYSPRQTSSLSFANDFIYDPRIELSSLALERATSVLDEMEAQSILDRVKEEKNPSLVEICIRTISNPVVLSLLAEKADDSLLEALTKNRYLPPCVVEKLLAHRDEELLYNLSQYATLTDSQQEQLLAKAIENNDLKLFHSLIENQELSSEMIERVINARVDLYERFVNENMPYLSGDLRADVLKSCEEQFAQSLGYNKSVSHSFISEQYGLEVSPLKEKELSIDDLSIQLKESSMIEIYDLLEGKSHPELFDEDIMAVATQEDLDPDIKRTVLLGMANRIGNSLQTLNSLQNELASISDNLIATVGESAVAYQKNSRAYPSARTFRMKSFFSSMYNVAQKSVAKGVEGMKSSVEKQVTSLKEELSKTIDSGIEATKQLYDKARAHTLGFKRIKITKLEKNKKGRRM